MLQVLIDPSMLTGKTTAKCAITLTLSGLAWNGDILPFTDDVSRDAFLQSLFPWKWNLPKAIGIVWLRKMDDNLYIKIRQDNLKLIQKDHTDYEHDLELLQKHYETVLRDKIIDQQRPLMIREETIKGNFNTKKEITVEIGDEEYSDVNFLSSSIAQFSQKLSPNNVGLKLTYFAEDQITIPEGADRFFAFPIGPDNDDNRHWGQRYHVMSSHGDSDRVCGFDDNDCLFDLQKSKEAKVRYIVGGDDRNMMELFCPITPIPEKITGSPIELRDEYGNFLGHTNVEVNDSDELFDKQNFRKRIIGKTAAIYDLPALFYEYLKSNSTTIGALNDSDGETFHRNANQILANLIRDRYSFCNALNRGNISSLIQRYNDEAKDTPGAVELNIDEAVSKIVAKDTALDSATWLSQLKKLEHTGKILRDTENKFIAGDSGSIERWLGLWKQIVNNRLQVIQKSDTDTAVDLKSTQRLLQIEKQELYHLHISEIKNGLFTGPDKEPSEKLFDRVLDDFFEPYDPDSAFIESIVINSTENDKDSHFNSDRISDIREVLLTRYLKNYLLKRADDKLSPPIKPALDSVASFGFNWDAFAEFVMRSFTDTAGTDPLPLETIDVNIETVINDLLKKTADIPPNVLVRVDTVGTLKSGTDKDDLSDEIAGHLIMMQRGDALNTEPLTDTSWKTLNWSRVILNSKTAGDNPLKMDYLIPAFLPESDGVKETCLAVSNENLSLIAGQDYVLDTDGEEQEPDFTFSYLFKNTVINELGERITRNVPPAYALWYGYRYNFAGFVSLNSGVLPIELRDDSEDWVLPKIGSHDLQNTTPYNHLRRVPFAKAAAQIGQPLDKVLMPLPEGLNLLANELPEKRDEPVYLLSEMQKDIQVKIGKPLTNFWNWYAWNGEQLTDDDLDRVFTAEMISRQTKAQNCYLHDPGLLNKVVVAVGQLFPFKSEELESFEIILDAEMVNFEVREIADKFLKVHMVGYQNPENFAGFVTADNTIAVPEGYVAKVSIHCLTRKDYFEPENKNKRFHSWMAGIINNESPLSDSYPDHYLTSPVELIFEAARKPADIINSQDGMMPLLAREKLWAQLIPTEQDGNVVLNIEKNDFNYSYFSKTVITHQVWHWNGRLASSLLSKDNTSDEDRRGFPENINPEHGKATNYAMKWEAWQFSDRPDYSALQSTEYLKASRGTKELQTLFKDNRPSDERALYYRFSAELYGRYELLGGKYTGTIKSSISIKDGASATENGWKRYVRLSTLSKQLPKPVIRFAIPLTSSVDECPKTNEIGSAPIMIVTNDTWFSEAGLAEELEVGIELLNHNGDHFLNAGPDPILTGAGLQPVTAIHNNERIELPEVAADNKKENPMALLTPQGPAGLTFDFATASPKLIGSTFILKTDDIQRFLGKDSPKIGPWSMARIALRRNVNKLLLRNSEENPQVDFLKSEWTAKQWIQFIPDTNSMIPIAWKKEHASYGTIEFTAANHTLTKADMDLPILTTDNDNGRHEGKTRKYMIISEKVMNAGGQPVESYRATYRFEGSSLVADDPNIQKFDPSTMKDGYARLIMIRVRNENDDVPLWEMLFGENTKSAAAFRNVQNDSRGALPLISKRFSITIK